MLFIEKCVPKLYHLTKFWRLQCRKRCYLSIFRWTLQGVCGLLPDKGLEVRIMVPSLRRRSPYSGPTITACPLWEKIYAPKTRFPENLGFFRKKLLKIDMNLPKIKNFVRSIQFNSLRKQFFKKIIQWKLKFWCFRGNDISRVAPLIQSGRFFSIGPWRFLQLYTLGRTLIGIGPPPPHS